MSGFDPNLISSTSSFVGNSALQDTSAISNLTGTPNPFTAPVYDRSQQVSLSPGGNYLPTNTPQANIGAMDNQIKAAGAEAMLKQSQPSQLNALMMGKQMLAQSQPQQQQQQQQGQLGQIRRGQPVSVSDSITALLAPKLKKKQPISLL